MVVGGYGMQQSEDHGLGFLNGWVNEWMKPNPMGTFVDICVSEKLPILVEDQTLAGGHGVRFDLLNQGRDQVLVQAADGWVVDIAFGFPKEVVFRRWGRKVFG